MCGNRYLYKNHNRENIKLPKVPPNLGSRIWEFRTRTPGLGLCILTKVCQSEVWETPNPPLTTKNLPFLVYMKKS